jgi:type I restriction enzyme S subunit
MNNDWFFEKFALIADAPGAVARMRGLILLYAVQARLVPPQADDAPVSKLVQDLREAKNAISRGSRNRETDFDCVGVENLPFEIPTHWTSVRLCDIGQISGGHTPSKNNARYWNGEIQWFTSKDIKCNELFESEIKITDNAVNSPGLQLYPSGCLFMVARSGILKRTFPVAINRVPAAVNQDLKVLRPFVKGMEQYLQLMLRGLTDFIISRLVKTGMTVQSLKYDEFANQVFPLPPVAEQKRIVAKVDELMGICDALESQQQERDLRKSVLVRSSLSRFAEAPTPENLGYLFHKSYDIPPSELRKSILTLAVQGKLVPQDSNDEPADLMLERLDRGLTLEQRRRQADPLSPIAEDEIQFETPANWKWARFRDVAIIASNLVKPNDFLDFIHLAPDNIEKGNGVLLSCKTVREDKVISSNHRFYPGQIVYSKIRPNLAKVVVVDFDGLCSADMYPIDAIIDPFYLQCFMLSEIFLVQAIKNDTRVAMPKINQMELNSIAVPVPPLAEQRRIVAKVDQLMALVDDLERQQEASLENASKLLDAIVQEMTSSG